MQFFKYALVFTVCLALIDFTEAFRFRLRRVVRKIGRGIKRVVKKVGKAVKKVGCKLLFGIGCPTAVTAAGAVIGAGSGGLGGAAAGVGVALGVNACHVRKEKCRRSVTSGEMLFPFSDEFSDFDKDQNKEIDFEEFQLAVMGTFLMADPEELLEPFMWTDADYNGVISPEEFQGAPFLFKHVEHPGKDSSKPFPVSMVSPSDHVTGNTTSPAA